MQLMQIIMPFAVFMLGLKQPAEQQAKVLSQRKWALVVFEPDPVPPQTFLRQLKKSLPSIATKKFAPHFAKLEALANDKNLLVEGGEAPSASAVACARDVLEQLETENMVPTKVVASAEGGVAICFVEEIKYADIECLNSGEILGVISNRRDNPTVWKINSSAFGFSEAAGRIRNFFIDAT